MNALAYLDDIKEDLQDAQYKKLYDAIKEDFEFEKVYNPQKQIKLLEKSIAEIEEKINTAKSNRDKFQKKYDAKLSELTGVLHAYGKNYDSRFDNSKVDDLHACIRPINSRKICYSYLEIGNAIFNMKHECENAHCLEEYSVDLCSRGIIEVCANPNSTVLSSNKISRSNQPYNQSNVSKHRMIPSNVSRSRTTYRDNRPRDNRPRDNRSRNNNQYNNRYNTQGTACLHYHNNDTWEKYCLRVFKRLHGSSSFSKNYYHALLKHSYPELYEELSSIEKLMDEQKTIIVSLCAQISTIQKEIKDLDSHQDNSHAVEYFKTFRREFYAKYGRCFTKKDISMIYNFEPTDMHPDYIYHSDQDAESYYSENDSSDLSNQHIW